MTTLSKDLKYVWHPFTQMKTAISPLEIVRGEGLSLFDEKGREYWDMISSWWVNMHGHAHPRIAAAISKQAQTLEHVIFAGFTHSPAASLSKRIVRLLPQGLKRVFFSDNGSTAVEVSLKMAYQFWHNQGQVQRKRYLAFDGGYHGDTFGAMAVGNSSGFFDVFKDFFFDVDFIPFPETWIGDETAAQKEEASLAVLENILEEKASEISAMIMEPLIQGAGGMRFCGEDYLRKVVALLKRYGVLVIFDEVMTGFGRTGHMFACQKAGVTPDMICLSKGITGGFLPLSMTICTETIYEAFLSDEFDKGFIHGHSYTANPLGCAAGLASLDIFEEEDVLTHLRVLEEIHVQGLKNLEMVEGISKTRVKGTVAAFEVSDPQGGTGYRAPIGQTLKQAFMNEGLIIRPLGNCVYLMPPYCITAEQLQTVYQKLASVLKKCRASS